MVRVRPRIRWAATALVVATLTSSCAASDPGRGLPPAPDPLDDYATWIASWSGQADAYSSAYSSVIGSLRAGSFDTGQLQQQFATLLAPTAGLSDRLAAIGPPPSSPVTPPDYDRAIRFATDVLGTRDHAFQQCTSTCQQDFEGTVSAASAVFDLVVMSAAMMHEPSSALRTVPIDEAMVSADDIGADPTPQQGLPPFDSLCEPDYEQTSPPDPDRHQVADFILKSGYVVHEVASWTSPADARHAFEQARVRAAVCPDVTVRTTRATRTWQSATSGLSGVPVTAWEQDLSSPGSTIRVVGVAALVDDTVVATVIIGRGDAPTTAAVDAIVRRQIRLLGAGPSLEAS
jgi:hypothetical protein